MVEKSYIESQYRLAWLDFVIAKSEFAKWEARKVMARLEEIASKAYGFAYADSLANLRK